MEGLLAGDLALREFAAFSAAAGLPLDTFLDPAACDLTGDGRLGDYERTGEALRLAAYFFDVVADAFTCFALAMCSFLS